MDTITRSPAPRKSALEITSFGAAPGEKIFVSITCNGKRSDYWFERIRSDIGGLAVHVSKIWDGKTNDFAAEEYDVLLDGSLSHYSCECMGHLRHGYCRHITAAIQLLAEGKLQPAPRPEHAPERPAKQQSAFAREDV